MTDSQIGEGVLVCIPTYNERENILKIVPAVLDAAPHSHVLVIDDNSPDGTGKLADELAADDKRVFVLHRQGKEGLGKAYLAGFRWALEQGYNRVIEFDADFSHNPKYLPDMIELLKDADVVVGSRRVPGGGTENWGLLRSFVSSAGSLYARTVLGMSVRDLTGGFNGWTKEALMAIDYERVSTSGYGFQIELKYRAAKADLSIVEMPIVFVDREEGVSKMSTGIFVEAMIGVVKLRLGL